jgi:hypothetical protein
VIAALTSGIGSRLADRWAAALLSPAFAFWAIGALAWLWTRPAEVEQMLDDLARLSPLAQAAASVGALLVVVASGFAVERLALPALRLLEGYWPPALRNRAAGRARRRLQANEDRWQQLYARWESGAASDAETAELLAVERRLAVLPAQSAQVMPTRLGNVLRAAESRPADFYGLDAVRCWPRLWLLLPDAVKVELGAARAELDAAATWWIWAVLIAVWGLLTPWAVLVAAAAALLAYVALLAAATRFGELLGATFDLHRGLLYDALGWPRPSRPDEERARGEALTQALVRGPGAASVQLVEPPSPRT